MAEFYPKIQRLPWLDAHRHERIQRMREYIRIGYGAASIRRKSAARRFADRVLGPIARTRLHSGNYEFPLELWSMKAVSRARHALGVYNVKRHMVQS